MANSPEVQEIHKRWPKRIRNKKILSQKGKVFCNFRFSKLFPMMTVSALRHNRQRELIVLIRRGLQDKEIADEMNISKSTVHAHISNIMRKYKLHNRTQIAVTFMTQSI